MFEATPLILRNTPNSSTALTSAPSPTPICETLGSLVRATVSVSPNTVTIRSLTTAYLVKPRKLFEALISYAIVVPQTGRNADGDGGLTIESAASERSLLTLRDRISIPVPGAKKPPSNRT